MKKRTSRLHAMVDLLGGGIFLVFPVCLVFFGFTASAILAGRAWGFTQHAGVATGNIAPMGHEWITRLAAVELLGDDQVLGNDPDDPRETWTDRRGLAKNTSLDRAQSEVKRIRGMRTTERVYAATYQPVWDAIIGERWVDIGGHNFTESAGFDDVNCLDMVAQAPADIQYDHFMRRYDEVGGQGGVDAAKGSKEAFIRYFVNAATARSGPMMVYDGGGYAGLVTVDRNYFLFGRALHLLEDSFSPEHTVRVKGDNFEKVRQVKSYLCAPGSEQHDHPKGVPSYDSGDVIWNPQSKWAGTGFSTYKPSNMKRFALVATEATKDAWAAFIRTMATSPGARADVARQEAEAIAAQWLSLSSEDETRTWYAKKENRDKTYVRSTKAAEDGGTGRTVVACMSEDMKTQRSQADQVKMIDSARRTCLYNMVPIAEAADNVDPSLHLAYNWFWRSKGLATPPVDWKISNPPPALPRVQIVSRQTRHPMAVGGNDWIYCDGDKDHAVLEFDIVGTLDDGLFRVANRTNSFLNQSDGGSGQVGLYSSSNKGLYKLERRPDGSYNIRSNHWNLYMHVDDYKPSVHKAADPSKLAGQWLVTGLPEPYLADGFYRIVTATEKVVYAGGNPSVGSPLGVESPHAASADNKARFSLTRQSNGTYIIESVFKPGLYVQSTGADGKPAALSFRMYDSPIPATMEFYMEEERGTRAYHRIRSVVGRQVWRELPDKGIGTEAESFFIPPAGCEDGGGLGIPKPGFPPPNIGGRCNDPTLFVLRRLDWP